MNEKAVEVSDSEFDAILKRASKVVSITTDLFYIQTDKVEPAIHTVLTSNPVRIAFRQP